MMIHSMRGCLQWLIYFTCLLVPVSHVFLMSAPSKTVPLPVSACHHSIPSASLVSIKPCYQYGKMCILEKPGNYTLYVHFNSQREATKVYLKLFALFGKKSVKFPLFSKQDLCQMHTGLKCPIQANHSYVYQMMVQIPKLTPDMVGTFRLQLVNQDRDKLLCSQFPFVIQKN